MRLIARCELSVKICRHHPVCAAAHLPLVLRRHKNILLVPDIFQYQISLNIRFFRYQIFQYQIFFNIRHIFLSFIFQYQIFFSIRYLSVSDIFQYQVSFNKISFNKISFNKISFNKISFNIRCLLMSDISQYQISFNITYIAISDILYTAYVYSRTLSL